QKCRQNLPGRLHEEKDHRGFCLGRLVSPRRMSNETLGEIPHFWGRSAHLEPCLYGALFSEPWTSRLAAEKRDGSSPHHVDLPQNVRPPAIRLTKSPP